jgi:hypothetical protein
VLDRWHDTQQFVAVMPRDFKRVKAAEAKARLGCASSRVFSPAWETNGLKATGFIETPASDSRPPATERVGDYRHVYYAYPADE